MPFHLRPDPDRALTRRELLAGLAVGGGVLGVAGAVRPAAPDAAGPWFALVSDTHIAGDPKAKVRGQVMAENLGAVVADILGAGSQPEGVLIDGDLALLDGRAGDYAALLASLEPIRAAGVPLHFTLGNHDDRANFRAAVGKAMPLAPLVEAKQVGAFDALSHRFVLLDSLDQVNVTPGLLGPAQLGWLAHELDEGRGRPTLVFVHHNPKAVKVPGLIDDAALLAVLAGRPWVRALIYGHTHTWVRSRQGELDLINLPAVGYPFAANQPIGYCRLRASGGRATLELRAVGADRSRHGETWNLAWGA